MILNIDFLDETNEVKSEHIELVEKLLQHAAKVENIEEGSEVSVTFVTNAFQSTIYIEFHSIFSQNFLAMFFCKFFLCCCCKVEINTCIFKFYFIYNFQNFYIISFDIIECDIFTIIFTYCRVIKIDTLYISL